MRSLRFLAISIVAPISLCAFAQTTPPATTQNPPGKTDQATTPAQTPKSDYKAYDTVITKEAVSQDGVFKVHRVEDKVFWEIPAKLLERDFLWQSEISRLSEGASGYSGLTANSSVVKFTRRNKKVYIRASRHLLRGMDDGVKEGLDQISVDPILFQFDVQTEGNDKSAVIEVTTLFMSDPDPFSVRGMFGSPGPDSSKSWIDKIKAFPTNIETRSNITFLSGAGRSANPFAPPSVGGPTTAMIHYSLLLLPEVPMMPRFKDSRIGYFTQGYTEFKSASPVKDKEIITRFRLEKKDPNAELSEPVKPITFYLAREVPDRWRPALKRGVEAWNVAYEKAGFKNAVVCLDAPTKEQDPDWDAEDARYSVIRWAPSKTANAMGPSIQDPRSGETMNAHIIFWHNIIDLLEKWYFTQSAAIDPQAKSLPLPPDLIDKLVQYVCTHEVGHTLGLEHNFRASSAYTIQQLRDPEFVKHNGVSSSIMSYSRNNYVAQPGDGITYSTNGVIGPYDIFAIDYGYRVFPNIFKPEDEIPHLDRMLARQINDRTVRFGNYKYNIDPTTQSENISDDPVEATRLGLLNLDRIGKNLLLPATTKFGEDYTYLSDIYSELQTHRLMWLLHVVKQVGGVVEYDNHSGRGGDVFKPVPKAQQDKAVKFLATTGLTMPPGMLNPEVLKKIQPEGYLSTANGMQTMLLSQLFAEARLRRLFDWQHMDPANAYTVESLTSTVFSGVWSEVAQPRPAISMGRRDLQRNFLTTMEGRLSGSGRSRTDFALIGSDALRTLARQIDKAIPVAQDKMTAAHLKDSRQWIERILTGKTTNNSAGSSSSIFEMFGIKEGTNLDHSCCFSKESMLREILRSLEK